MVPEALRCTLRYCPAGMLGADETRRIRKLPGAPDGSSTQLLGVSSRPEKGGSWTCTYVERELRTSVLTLRWALR
eukprot:scaffold16638_cov120-Isochrysis_galbana.AAC.3